MIEQHVTDLCKDNINSLLDMCYELLKIAAERNDDGLVEDLLYGQVRPDILRVLITSNFYDTKTKMVLPKPDIFFRLVVGNEGLIL